ncbi:efflux RND transporter periplasmic adaptor subunit [Neobacillus niacini]|uniref:efflux RND transporter periplasmic adaptor subunit n=1 Tax=Neobacillus niacini TaxID=86668 RepID=UPI0021CB7D35|nr:HlyD family efflux transporter periplasmic adaptor subunit [Neobacillus niacini]MCM3763366.1 HlyD family efflux transporter periplasmic adaptor subunit [Neobacillus niacini]
MKKKKVWIWIVSLLVLLGIGGTVTYFLTKGEAKMAGGETEAPPLTVQKASERELAQSILVTGKIVPESEQKIFIEPEKGAIKEMKVTENQTVKAGDPLLVYDSAKIDTELARAVRSKDLLTSRAKTEQNQIADVTKRHNDAKKKLSAQSTNSEGTEEVPVSQETVNQLANEKIQLEMQYESTKSEIASAEDQIKELNAQKNAMTVVSKMDGIVVKVNPNVAKTEAGSAEPVIHIISSQPYKVIGTMSEFDAVKIQHGQPVIIRPKVFKDREWKGSIESVSQFPTEDGGGGGEFGPPGGGNVTMYPFKVAITDDTSELRQGFHVSLEIKVGGGEKPLVVPHPAMVDEGGIKVVYVLVNKKIERREVKTGAMNDEFIEITEGVKQGELVVITPNEQMHDGMEVTSFDEVE